MSEPTPEPTPVIPDHLPDPEPIVATDPVTPEPVADLPEHLVERHDEGIYTEWGLKTPDGAIHWKAFANNDISTPEARFMMRIRIRQTATELGFDPEVFVAQYQWVGRVVEQKTDRKFTDAGIVPIDSDSAAPPPQNQPQPQPQLNGQQPVAVQ